MIRICSEFDIQIAICTADSRTGTMRTLQALGVEHLVDLVVCGDDQGSQPKPQPDNALYICRQLGVEPKVGIYGTDRDEKEFCQ